MTIHAVILLTWSLTVLYHPQIVPRSGSGLSPDQGSGPKSQLGLSHCLSEDTSTYWMLAGQFMPVGLRDREWGPGPFLFINMDDDWRTNGLTQTTLCSCTATAVNNSFLGMNQSRTKVLWLDLQSIIKLDHRWLIKGTFTQELSKRFCKTCRYTSCKLVCFLLSVIYYFNERWHTYILFPFLCYWEVCAVFQDFWNCSQWFPMSTLLILKVSSLMQRLSLPHTYLFLARVRNPLPGQGGLQLTWSLFMPQ